MLSWIQFLMYNIWVLAFCLWVHSTCTIDALFTLTHDYLVINPMPFEPPLIPALRPNSEQIDEVKTKGRNCGYQPVGSPKGDAQRRDDHKSDATKSEGGGDIFMSKYKEKMNQLRTTCGKSGHCSFL